MKTLIAYASTHGCTEKCASTLKAQLKGDVELVNLRKIKNPDLLAYDTVIIGGSIHAGRMQGAVKRFCGKQNDNLKTKKLGLFLCCMEEGDNAWKEFNEGYPQELIDHATAKGLFGGEFDFEKMNAIEKVIIKKIGKIDKSVSKIFDANIKVFAEQMK